MTAPAVVLGLWCQGDRWFLQRRDPANPVLPGLWEFPGGKVEPGESLEAALVREWGEEVGNTLVSVRAEPDGAPGAPFQVYLVVAEGNPRSPWGWGWFTAEDLQRLPLPPANAALLARLSAMGGGRNLGPAGLI